MSERTPSIDKLEKQLRVLKKKLERSEWHRVDLENQHDRDQHLYRRLHADLEAAHRKAQVEAALERVRSVAMAMRTPADLSGISETVFTELKDLGLVDLRNTEIIINHDTDDSITSYYYSDYGVTGIVDVAYTTNPILAAWARDMQEADDAFAEVVIAEDEMEDWRAYRLSLGYVPDPKLDEATTVYYYSYSIGSGALSISSFRPVDAEQITVLAQFRNVFNLAYQRYVDIARAEAQAREAEIELALERVRARTMAMQKSTEISEVAQVLYQQLQNLGGQLWGTGFAFCSTASDADEFWFVNQGGILPPVTIPNTEDPVHRAMYEGWKKEMVLYSEAKGGAELKAHYEYMLTVPDVKDIFQGILESGLSFPTWQKWHAAYFSHGYLLVITVEPYEEERTFSRFAKVFEQAYIRFGDLQRAEAQAREAQIEAALERIRTQSLRMLHSSELVATSAVFHEQLLALGIATEFSYVWLPDEAAGKHQFWATWTSEEDGEPVHHSRAITYDLDRSEPYTAACFAAWASDDPIHVEQIPPGDVEHFFATWEELIGGAGHLRSERFPEGLHYAEGYMAYGCLGINIRQEPTEAERDILRRFAVEFERTYTRFLDLRRAEAQAREAQIEASLERVRARAMAMHSSDDLSDATAIVFTELEKLGISTLRCGIVIIDETRHMDTWTATATSEERDVRIVGRIDTTIHPLLEGVFEAWKAQQPFFTYELAGEDLQRYYQALRNAPDYAFPQDARPSARQFHYTFFFSEGALFNFSEQPLAEESSQIFMRFTAVFALTYRRYLDLKKAEEQAREAQIEAALERVRSRTMAMHQSEELGAAIFTLFSQVRELGIPTVSNWVSLVDDERETIEIWVTHGEEDVKPTTVHASDHENFRNEIDAWRGGQDIAISMPEDAAKAALKNIFKIDLLAPEIESHFHLLQIRHKYGFVGLSTWEAVTEVGKSTWEAAKEEDRRIVKRFARVFEQTYTRFLDLKKAEAQAREAQIEASLERVRARAMAMHTSDDLSDATAIVFTELERLGITTLRCGINIIRDSGHMDLWTATATENDSDLRVLGRLDVTMHPMLKEVFEAWKAQQPYFTYALEGEDMRAYYQALKDAPDYSFPTDANPSGSHFAYLFSFTEGGLFAFAEQPLAEEAIQIFNRFAAVFALTYTRFLDLQKAEAQAREAQIEAALEKVRSRTMAMHAPDELQEVVTVVAERLMDLGVVMDAGGVIICTYFPHSKDVLHWLASSDFSSSKPYLLPYFDHPIFNEAWASRESGDEFFSKAFTVEEKNSFFLHAFEHSDYKYFPDEFKEWVLAAEHHALTFAWSNNAAILIPSFTDIFPSESDKEILKRFARVFEQAYIRFLDLQQAAEQAREAERQAALDRVRAEIASMRTAADLERITPLVWRELTTLGVPFFRCGVFIIDEAADAMQVFLTNPEGKALAVLHLGFDDAPLVTATVAHWRKEAVYTEEWDAMRMREWTRFLQERGHIETSTRYLDAEAPPEHLALHFVPFAQGMLYVGSREPLDAAALDTVQALADAFAVAYARYEDFQRLEAAKTEVEATLSDLQAAQQQLVHAEKMASLGALTAGIAHEIKNPLNFINNFSELVVELVGELDDELDRDLDAPLRDVADEFREKLADLQVNAEQIHKHGRRADGIVQAMMQHASGGSGQRQPTDVNALVSEYIDLAYHGKRAQVPGFTCEIEKDLGADTGPVEMVPQEIGRVVLNLLGNAFDAVMSREEGLAGRGDTGARRHGDGTPATSGTRKGVQLNAPPPYVPTVRVTTRRDGDAVEIRISDNGVGIPHDVRDRIFEPFFTTKPTGSGTGLGLSLSYDIVTQGHGGTLKVKSEEGHGAAFIVMLPVNQRASESSA